MVDQAHVGNCEPNESFEKGQGGQEVEEKRPERRRAKTLFPKVLQRRHSVSGPHFYSLAFPLAPVSEVTYDANVPFVG
jgi:hypothetical protein